MENYKIELTSLHDGREVEMKMDIDENVVENRWKYCWKKINVENRWKNSWKYKNKLWECKLMRKRKRKKGRKKQREKERNK